MKKLPTGNDLIQLCQRLGVDTSAPPITQSIMRSSKPADDFELQRRLIEAERSHRESKLWLIAVISAIASVVSAITALVAVFVGK